MDMATMNLDRLCLFVYDDCCVKFVYLVIKKWNIFFFVFLSLNNTIYYVHTQILFCLFIVKKKLFNNSHSIPHTYNI